MNPLRVLLRAFRGKRELQEELESHLNLAIADRVARGESPETARRGALREFGNMPLVADVTRERWGWLRLEGFLLDLKFAGRQLRKTPGFTVTALLTLTLAIGANTAIFTLAYALMLRNLPVSHPEQLVQVQMKRRAQMGKGEWEPTVVFSGGFFDVVRAQQKVFSGLCAWDSTSLNLKESDGIHPIEVAAVSGDCFRTLGVKAAIGRLFTAEEDREGGGPQGYPVVLSYNAWQSRFGGDPAVMGRKLNFQGKPAVVIGVARAGFRSVEVAGAPVLYAPSEIGDHEELHRFGSFNRLIVARLRDGVSESQAAGQLDAAYNAWIDATHPEWRKNAEDFNGVAAEQRIFLTPARTGYSYLREGYKKPLLVLQTLVGMCLLIACAYLATMFSARAVNRRQELALRFALGAGRLRIVGQLLSEALLLAVAGAALGSGAAWAMGKLLATLLISFGRQINLDTSPQPAILAFTIGLSLLTLLLAGLFPAWRASRIDPARDVQPGRQSMFASLRRGRLGAWLMPLQIAFSLVIVTAAVLLSGSLVKLLSQDLGFQTKGVFFIGTDFGGRHQSPKQLAPALGDILDRLNHAPGIEAASLSETHQLSGAMYMDSARRVLPSGEVRADPMVLTFNIAPRYLETTGTSLVAGREFNDGDHETTAPVCLLNQSAAHYYFPDGDALGGVLTINGSKQPARVVGIAHDTKNTSLREATDRMIYVPFRQAGLPNPFPELVVKSSSPAMALSSVRGVFQQLAPDVPLAEPLSMQQALNGVASQERLLAVLANFLALLALLLTAIGIYGLLNSEVSWRRTEIAIRMSLGASRERVVRMVLRQAARLVLPGLALGAVGAAALSRVFKSLLYQTSPVDPGAFLLSISGLLAVAVIAALLPARKAASVDPMEALRSE